MTPLKIQLKFHVPRNTSLCCDSNKVHAHSLFSHNDIIRSHMHCILYSKVCDYLSGKVIHTMLNLTKVHELNQLTFKSTSQTRLLTSQLADSSRAEFRHTFSFSIQQNYT